MIVTLIAIVSSFLLQTKQITDYSIMYRIIDDTVVCINADTEYHYVSNMNYETVTCSFGKNSTLVFLIPPATVSNTVQCTMFSDKYEYCPSPWRVESDRQLITDLDDKLRILNAYDWITNQGY